MVIADKIAIMKNQSAFAVASVPQRMVVGGLEGRDRLRVHNTEGRVHHACERRENRTEQVALPDLALQATEALEDVVQRVIRLGVFVLHALDALLDQFACQRPTCGSCVPEEFQPVPRAPSHGALPPSHRPRAELLLSPVQPSLRTMSQKGRRHHHRPVARSPRAASEQQQDVRTRFRGWRANGRVFLAQE